MSIARHEAGHAICARALGWNVKGITLNEEGGITRVGRPPNQSSFIEDRQWMTIILAGELAETPDATAPELLSRLTGTDRDQFHQAMRRVWPRLNAEMKRSFVQGMLAQARSVLETHADELNELEHDLANREYSPLPDK